MTDDNTTIAEEVAEALRDAPEDVCPWTDDADEQRRVFVLVQFGVMFDLDKMERICQWLKDGTLPHKLKAVKD